MRKGLKRFALALVAVGLSIVLLLTAAVPVCEARSDERVVKIGWFTAWTGTMASQGVPWGTGIKDYVRYVNEHGGIDGIKIELPWREVGVTMVPGTVTAFKRFREEGCVALFHWGTTPIEVIVPSLQRDEIPLFSLPCYTVPEWTEPIRWVFASTPGWCPEALSFMKWVKKEWAEPRPPRIGMIFYDHSSGWDGFRASEYADEIGVEFVGHEVVPLVGAIDVSTELLRLAAKKPDWVYAIMYGATTVTTVKDSARLGLVERINFCSSNIAVDESLVDVTGNAANGWYCVRSMVSNVQTEVPGLMFHLDNIAKPYHGWGLEDISGFYLTGFCDSMTLVEGIRLAIEKVGYENLTGRAVRDGLASIRDFDLGDFAGIIPPVTMSDDFPSMVSCLRIYKVKDCKFYPFSDWFEPTPFMIE